MDIQFMKDYYDLRYEETEGENHVVNETAYQEKQSEQSKMEDQLMEMVGGSESNVWKLYESIMCVYFDMEEIIKQAVYLQGAYITNLIHASVDPKTVQYLAGHENSKITMDIYAKAKYNRPDELAGILEDTFTLWDAE